MSENLTHAILVSYWKIQRSMKNFETLESQFQVIFITKYLSRSPTLESYFMAPPCLFKSSIISLAWACPFYTPPSYLKALSRNLDSIWIQSGFKSVPCIKIPLYIYCVGVVINLHPLLWDTHVHTAKGLISCLIILSIS